MLEIDIIEPSVSPRDSPIVLVHKKDGSTRFCVEYRKLNAVTKRDSHPLPHIQESLDLLGQTRYFTTLDLFSEYWQVEMDELSKEYTAFATYDGLLQQWDHFFWMIMGYYNMCGHLQVETAQKPKFR